MFKGSNRFNDDEGPRGGSPNPQDGMETSMRAGFGSEQSGEGSGQVLSSGAGAPHSSAGFRRALMKSTRGSSRLKDQLPNKTSFGGPGFKKPNYFAQGGGRHGMHIGSGAPFTGPASGDAGAGFGGE